MGDEGLEIQMADFCRTGLELTNWDGIHSGAGHLGRKGVNCILKYMGHLSGGLQLMVGDKDLWSQRKSGMKSWGNYQPFER